MTEQRRPENDGPRFLRFDGQPTVSAFAFNLHCSASVSSVKAGFPGFVSDGYLHTVVATTSADTTTAVWELEAAGMWQRREGGYFIIDDELRGAGTDVGFTTNGRHLTEDAVARLVELGARSIAVSVDTLDPALFRRIRGGDLQPTLAGIERLAAVRPPGMDVFTTSVMMQLTFDGFPELIQYAEDTGLSMPSCQPLQMKPSYVSHYRGLDYRTQALRPDQLEWLGQYGARRAAYRKKRGLRTFYESVQEAAAPEARCGFVEHSVHLRFDGNMFACCFIKEDEFTLGQIGSATVLELIDSKNRHDMRSEIAAGRTPAPCAGCHVLRR